jgi:tRNA(Arg) A34 adenosine deaminase TadA
MALDKTLSETELTSLAEETVELAVQCVKRGGIPFAALVVGPDGSVLGSGVNEVAEERDAVAHAEVVAMRAAGSRSNHFRLHRAILIASGEPCALCYHAALYFNIGEIAVIATRDEAAKYGFDYTASYRIFATDPKAWSAYTVRRIPLASGLEPFRLWQLRNAT